MMRSPGVILVWLGHWTQFPLDGEPALETGYYSQLKAPNVSFPFPFRARPFLCLLYLGSWPNWSYESGKIIFAALLANERCRRPANPGMALSAPPPEANFLILPARRCGWRRLFEDERG